ncbi:hypothetical protein L484_010011 [Morus notabilis]|uniref:Uncharacterized protein n=1 Tax=Morus notabilis TaxID=981085 RepID=W9QG02_9ROSA|nr:hypothetical protein L484_010011 [Morus notabilis]
MSLLSPYDTSAPLNPNCLSNTTSSLPQEQRLLWPPLASAIKSSIVWDSVYFVRITHPFSEDERAFDFEAWSTRDLKAFDIKLAFLKELGSISAELLTGFKPPMPKKNLTKIDNYGILLRYQDCNCPCQAL